MSFYWLGLSIAVIFQLTKIVQGHSWIACTDYAMKNAADYNHDLCRAYPRDANQKAPRGGQFGEDTGFNHQPQTGMVCGRTRNANNYDSNHPKAIYYPGQQVVLAHPMKNHGADVGCTNKFIPDSSNAIYRTDKGATVDPSTLAEFRSRLVVDLGVSPVGNDISDDTTTKYPKPGFQNAPKFCENTDKSLGTYSFNVPTALEPGEYTFLWLWEFNPGSFYSNCFEVIIVASREERNAELAALGFGNLLYEPCGGLTSDGVTQGNSNPGCTSSPGGSSTTSTSSPGASSTTFTSSPGGSSTTSTTTISTTVTTTEGNFNLEVYSNSLTGDIQLPPVPTGITKRTIEVVWDCPTNANFWNCDGNPSISNGVYYLTQSQSWQLSSQKISYHITFSPSCENFKPLAMLINEE